MFDGEFIVRNTHNNVYTIVVGDARDKTLSCCSQEAEITMFRLSNNKFFKLSTFVPHSIVQFFCVPLRMNY